jgi:hypothetical protein
MTPAKSKKKSKFNKLNDEPQEEQLNFLDPKYQEEIAQEKASQEAKNSVKWHGTVFTGRQAEIVRKAKNLEISFHPELSLEQIENEPIKSREDNQEINKEKPAIDLHRELKEEPKEPESFGGDETEKPGWENWGRFNRYR